MNEHEEIRRKLIEKLAALERRVGRITGDVRRSSEPLHHDSEEQAVETANDQVLDGLDRVARSEIEKINATLARIERNEFGNCTKCGQPIPVRRLEALPYTEHCVECAAP